MDIMVGLPGGRKILIVLLAQLTALFLSMAASLFIIAQTGSSSGASQITMLPLLSLLMSLAIMGAIGMSLSALSEPIELLLSINAKRRLEGWVIPALWIGAGLAAVSLGLHIIVSLAGFSTGSSLASWGLMALSAGAYLAPLAALAVFSTGAAKRYLAMRQGAKRMSGALQPRGNTADDGLTRVRNSLATELGTATTNVRPNPQGFTLAGITSRPYHAPADFEWMRAFEQNFEKIRDEAETVLKAHNNRVDIYNYPGLDGDQWKAFKFVSRHTPIAENMALCPVTASLLKTIPGFPVFRDAMFSILAPGGEIERHRDVSNIFLTAHFGLFTPDDAFMEVAGDRRPWCEGEFLVFDSAYEHRAVNNSTKPRIVLLIDFLHPEINADERDWIKTVGL